MCDLHRVHRAIHIHQRLLHTHPVQPPLLVPVKPVEDRFQLRHEFDPVGLQQHHVFVQFVHRLFFQLVGVGVGGGGWRGGGGLIRVGGGVVGWREGWWVNKGGGGLVVVVVGVEGGGGVNKE